MHAWHAPSRLSRVSCAPSVLSSLIHRHAISCATFKIVAFARLNPDVAVHANVQPGLIFNPDGRRCLKTLTDPAHFVEARLARDNYATAHLPMKKSTQSGPRRNAPTRPRREVIIIASSRTAHLTGWRDSHFLQEVLQPTPVPFQGQRDGQTYHRQHPTLASNHPPSLSSSSFPRKP